MKVLHLLNTGSYSGAENVAITIIKNTQRDFEGHYASLEGSIEEILKKKNIPYHPMKKMSVSEIRRIIKDVQPDLIHAHDYTCSIMAVLSCRNIPIVSHLHNNSPWIKKYGIYSFVYGLSCFRYQKILTVSDSIVKEYVFGTKIKSKTVTLGNPIDVREIKKQAKESNDKASYDVVFLGRLTPPKKPLYFLEIISNIKKEFINVRSIMIGDGELRNEVCREIERLNLEDNVKLAGFQKNPYVIVKQGKLLCMPSAWEGYGLAAVEAMALGLPVVSSGAGGLSNIVNEDCGKICQCTDDYSKEILKLLTDKQYHDRKSLNSISRANELSNINIYIEQLEKIYEAAMGGMIDD